VIPLTLSKVNEKAEMGGSEIQVPTPQKKNPSPMKEMGFL